MQRLSTFLLLLSLAIAATSSAKAAEDSTTIYRDEFGIPHVFASTLEDATFAVGYAQAEDRLEELLKNYRRANGTMAEVFGPSFLQDDVMQRLMRHTEISRDRYDQVTPKVRGLIESYQRGIKQFMREHPEQVPSWAQEIHPWDAIAFGRHIIWNWPIGESAGDLEHAGIKFRPGPYLGSNQMLIAPSRSASKAAVAIIDPHVSWYDAIRFYQVRVYTPEYNVAGVCLLGMPLPTLGHSQFCSVAMTTGGPDTSDSFELEVNPANPLQYRHDGRWRDMTLVGVNVGVKEGDKVAQKPMKFAYSHLGPIVARQDGKAYTMTIPYTNEIGLADQSYEMLKARNLGEMKTALSRLQLMSQNVMVATVQGDIYYLRNGRVPIRAKGTHAHKPIAGSESANEWHGIHPFQDLLQIENPACGWMQNCNCSPAAMMKEGGPKPSLYAEHPYLYNERDDRVRHQRSEMVNDLLEAADKVTVEQAIEIAFSTQVWHAELWQARLKDAWAKAATVADTSGDAGRVYQQIADWNRRSDPDSNGAMAYYAFKTSLGGEEAKQTEPPASLTDARLVEAVRKGAAMLKTMFGEVEAPFGRYFRVGRKGGDRTWPVGGGSFRDIGMATPRAVSFDPSPDGKQMIGRTGQTATQVVIMTDPPESYSINPLGASDSKESGHFDDQAEKLFSKGKAVQTYFLRPNELMKHVTSKKSLSPHRP
ncbi:Glutaryl-7-aminocephalosporanic-acid acylase [Paludisphaera borealis]|uniref:Glutaryl-7-aminocephalosporanic-acid acylase n=2 Tax=Paludisphaera borealis TaxID=1387353 RepID=A0A1U7CP18_9BACT|nr:Glutaryl-7-aminocephalosporanic-acid acylase [Paludisphaera borealis]